MNCINKHTISLALIALSAYMIYADKPNWGWLIFFALLIA